MLFVVAISAPFCTFCPIAVSLFGELWLKTEAYLIRKVAMVNLSCPLRKKLKLIYLSRLAISYREKCLNPMDKTSLMTYP